MVLHICAGFRVHRAHLPAGLHHKAYGESMEDLCEAICCAHGLTEGSLSFLNYSAQLIFKSTKVLPVMVMRSFIPGLQRKYMPSEYISAFFLIVGLILFTLADAQTSPNFSVLGVLMVTGAPVMDAFLGNVQEAIFTMNPETTQMEMLFCSTVVGLPMLIPPMILTGELFKAWKSCSQGPGLFEPIHGSALILQDRTKQIVKRMLLRG